MVGPSSRRLQPWHGLSADLAFYADGQLAEKVSKVGTAATLRSYDNITIGSGLSNASTEAYFDNMFLQVASVPEPSVGALALVGLGVLCRCRKHR